MVTITKQVTIEKEVNYMTISDFLDWLKDKGILDKFIYNLMCNRGRFNSYNIFIDTNVSDMIECAFDWNATQEGESFWTDVDLIWRRYCRRNNIEEELYYAEDKA